MAVRGQRGRLPQLGAAQIVLQQLPHRDRRRGITQARARRAVLRHQVAAYPLG